MFPSPIGELHFSIIRKTVAKMCYLFPSPIGELHFSIWSWSLLGMGEKSFPSPIGELHFSIERAIIAIFWCVFPSPIGELHFSIPFLFVFSCVCLCFRPLSGSYISQFRECKASRKVSVSVPYRGATFLNNCMEGDKNDRWTVSVPYRGATFLNLNIASFRLLPVLLKVSVPYRGATFLNRTV